MPGTMFWVQNATCSVSAKKLSTTSVEHEPTDRLHGHELLGDELRGVEHVERELVGELVVEQLDAELPLRGSRPA